MQIPAFDRKRRGQILRQRAQIVRRLVEIDELIDAGVDAAEERRLDAEETQLHEARKANLADYARVIPRMPLSICPFCERPLIKAFDPVGLEGFWWMDRTAGFYDNESVCGHFRLLRGALNLEGYSPQGGTYDARPGPEVPYVIPRILQMERMMLVISSIRMDCGYTAYPLAYFSVVDYPAGSMTAEWRRQEYDVQDPSGRWKFSIPQDPWDFDLDAWIRQGRVRWILPHEDNLAAPSLRPTDCPYLDLKGSKLPSVICEDRAVTEAVPDGQELELFD